jgi:hypothetical protein
MRLWPSRIWGDLHRHSHAIDQHGLVRLRRLVIAFAKHQAWCFPPLRRVEARRGTNVVLLLFEGGYSDSGKKCHFWACMIEMDSEIGKLKLGHN